MLTLTNIFRGLSELLATDWLIWTSSRALHSQGYHKY